MRYKRRIFESDIKYSKEERSAFLESLKMFGGFKNEIYRSKKLKEISKEIGNMIESAKAFTLQETQDGFDQISVNRDLKEIDTDYKIFEKTCNEMHQLQLRLENIYENIGTKLSKYYNL